MEVPVSRGKFFLGHKNLTWLNQTVVLFCLMMSPIVGNSTSRFKHQ